MARMSPEEIDAFLREPHIAMLATAGTDGSPHVTPVWHHYDGDKVYVAAIRPSVKVRNIRRNPRVSLCVFTDRDRSKYVQVNGTATLSEEGIPAMVRTMSRNYVGEDGWEAYSERVLREVRFALVTVTPSKILGVDEGAE